MKFEVVTDKGIPLMSCKTVSCIPDEQQLRSIYDAGHRFRLNGKSISIKKILEYVKENTETKI